MSSSEIQICNVDENDLEALVELRIKAMQPSLEAVGRFDPLRARERFVNSFVAADTQKIIRDAQLLGFYVMHVKSDHLWLDHLYIDPEHQGIGLGEQVLEKLKQRARAANWPLRLGALKESRANLFYLKNEFIQIETQQWDNIYQWTAIEGIQQCLEK
ncbi:N-acetyltransferase ['Osedax' symbiont bacterium Rs2_46_30_T18]|nr:N-acetyltransferase ['Osedax' symbiont bacterium Rs2_46_30_T18]